MAKITDWIHAFRLRTLPLALSTIIAGSTAAFTEGNFKINVLIWAGITTLLLQILSNIANDYGDALSGADKKRVGPKRMVISGQISKSAMLKMIILISTLSLLSGLYLLFISFPKLISFKGISFFILGIAAIGAAINYTMGKNPYGYKGLGDFFVFIFFGLVGTAGTYFLHTKEFNWSVLLLCIFTGFLSAGVLNVNNLRDEETDKEAGKKSIIVLFGKKTGIIYQFTLVIVGWISLITYTLLRGASFFNWIYLITIPLFIIHLKNITKRPSSTIYNKELKRLALSTFITIFIWCLSFFLG